TRPCPVLLGRRQDPPHLSAVPSGTAVAVVLLLAACTRAPAPRAVPSPSTAVSSSPSTATQVVMARFTAAGLAVGTYNEFLAGHDPNPPLGTAGVYAGATWHDGTLQRPGG